MRKGFFNECDISESDTLCFWLFLPIALIVLLFDALL